MIKNTITIKVIQKQIKPYGLNCVSRRYIDGKTNLTFKCKEGHKFEALYCNVLRGKCCPVCNQHYGESISRNSFQLLFKNLFSKVRPPWLKLKQIAPKGIELDGFCESLKLAFEYQGIQHYMPVKYFNKNLRFKEIIKRDKIKQAKCKVNDVKLIVIPYTIPLDKIPQFILTAVNKLGLRPKIPLLFFQKALILSSRQKEELTKIRKIVRKRQGKCLSKVYLGNFYKLEFQCERRHKWEATPADIKTGYWCPHCAHKARLTLKEMQKIAKKKGGKCLSKRYINNSTNLKWQCKERHKWEATPGNIKSGKWCPICRRKEGAEKQKDSIEHMQKIAKKKGGKCLSRKYVDNHTKLHWQCKKGHKWWAEPGNIKQDHWCPICGIKKRAKSQSDTIEHMRRIAKKKGGKCLSKKYANCHTPLRWQCKKGHKWEAIPSSIKSGHWCPRCARKIGWLHRKMSAHVNWNK